MGEGGRVRVVGVDLRLIICWCLERKTGACNRGIRTEVLQKTSEGIIIRGQNYSYRDTDCYGFR